ncbi:Kelch-like protein 4 [Elasticomyces elasticus]|nr:Kelch-like protein 4 [Elasticomyces elasticus]
MDSEATKIPADSFFNSPGLSDITLQCGDNKIHAHKVILAQGSPYFRQLFAQRDKDQQDETITLEGEPDALKGMVAWLYGLEYYGSDRVENRDQARYPEGSTDVCRVWCSADAGSRAYVLYLLALCNAGTRYDVSRLVAEALKRMPNALRYAHVHNDEALARKFYAAGTPPELKCLFAERCVDSLRSLDHKWTGKKDVEAAAVLLKVPELALDVVYKLL